MSSSVRTGRLAVRVEDAQDRSFSASFELQGSARAGRLSLSSPLGTQLGMAQWQPGRAWFSDGKALREYRTLDDLAQDTLGERVPLAALFDWLRGQPWSEQPSQALPAPAQGFSQLGWDVRLERLAQGLVVATREEAPRVTVRAKLDNP